MVIVDFHSNCGNPLEAISSDPWNRKHQTPNCIKNVFALRFHYIRRHVFLDHQDASFDGPPNFFQLKIQFALMMLHLKFRNYPSIYQATFDV